MSLVKRNNLIFPGLINDFFKPDWFGGFEQVHNFPAVNISHGEKEFGLELAIPGFKKDDFNIEIDNDVLTVSSETKSADGGTDTHYTRREFGFTSFKRTFTLPDTVDASKIHAAYEAGILKLVLPKKEEALPKPKRLVEIG